MKYVFMKASRARRAQTSKRNFTEWCSGDIWRALDGRFQLVSMRGTLRYSDVREGLKIAFLTLLLNEGAPASDEGKKKRAGSAFFEADRCRGRYACRVVLWLHATPRQKTPIPELQRSAHSPFRCFSDEKDRPTPETLYKGLESGCFQSVFWQY